jgi:hypothetical protein
MTDILNLGHTNTKKGFTMKRHVSTWIAAIVILALIWMAIMLAVWTLGFLIKIFFYALIFAVITFLVIKIYRKAKNYSNN